MAKKQRECIQTIVPGQYPVTVHQDCNKAALFTVTYGQQVTSELTYAQAICEYGACVFHALACAGRLDNNGRIS